MRRGKWRTRRLNRIRALLRGGGCLLADIRGGMARRIHGAVAAIEMRNMGGMAVGLTTGTVAMTGSRSMPTTNNWRRGRPVTAKGARIHRAAMRAANVMLEGMVRTEAQRR